MSPDDRSRFDAAMLRARLSAYPPGEFVGQESFMTRTEILSVARRAAIGPGVTVLDLCCGTAGPGRLVTAELGCTYRGLDRSAGAIEVARGRTAGLGCGFEVAEVPPVPDREVDVVLFLETMLAFRDKEPLLSEVAACLVPGGRFAFTVEEGSPLSAAERAAMPAADTVWPIRLADLVAQLRHASLELRWMQDRTRSHRDVAEALVAGLEAERPAIAADLGGDVVEDLLAAHRLWSAWMASGRVRKLAMVTEKPDVERRS
jgi:SAM-dependent methyltransferase